jgi:glyoxylase-like metal-dependent hydrolase (beta-lactamase superfamily II)
MKMHIRQLFDRQSSTYTYLVWDSVSRQAAIIDPVRDQVERDAKLVDELGLTLKFALETHIHADHITGSGRLRALMGCHVGVHKNAATKCSDLKLENGDILSLGERTLEVLYTPGHTDSDISLVVDGAVFTGDILLIRGSGRTDFQSGNAGLSYDSITQRLFSLPDETVIYPAHDYNGFSCSTVGEEKRYNPRLGNSARRDDYIRLMQAMKLDKPERMDSAVPGNHACGLLE